MPLPSRIRDWWTVPRDVPRNRLNTRYDSQGAYLPLARAVAGVERPRRRVVGPGSVGVAWQVDGTADGIAPFAVTTSKGLCLWSGGALRTVVPGPTFGLTRDESGAWLVFQQTGRHGRVLRVVDGPDGVTATTAVWGLSRWIHQIDLVGEHLVVTDTWRNRLLAYRLPADGRPVHADRTAWTLTVDREVRHGRASAGYRHVNSVHDTGDLLHVMAHNHSAHTGRDSEIWTYDREHRLVDITSTHGHCCHNVVPRSGATTFCRSLAGAVTHAGTDVYRTDGFTRGLAVDDHRILVGVSRFAADRARRDEDTASVDVLGLDLAPVARVVLSGCQIRDVRSTAGDLGLSNTRRDPSAVR